MKKLSGPFVLATILAAHIGLVIATEESYTFRSDDAPAVSSPAPAVDVNLTSIKTNASVNPNRIVSLNDNDTRIN